MIKNLKSKNPIEYYYNIDKNFSEVGSIRYDIFNGGPVRT